MSQDEFVKFSGSQAFVLEMKNFINPPRDAQKDN